MLVAAVHDLSNFYLAAAAVLPILLFTETVTKRMNFALSSEDVVDRIQRMQPRIRTVAGLIWWPFYGWSEWICLRSLELGHSAWGGTTVVWVALGLATFQLVGTDLIARWTEADLPGEPVVQPGGDPNA